MTRDYHAEYLRRRVHLRRRVETDEQAERRRARDRARAARDGHRLHLRIFATGPQFVCGTCGLHLPIKDGTPLAAMVATQTDHRRHMRDLT
jgi:hypothetical protein